MPASIDFGAFTIVEKQQLLTAAKTELLRRAGGGAIQTGASNGQSFSMAKMTEDGLFRIINSLSSDLGYEQPITQVAPNFSGRNVSSPSLQS